MNPRNPPDWQDGPLSAATRRKFTEGDFEAMAAWMRSPEWESRNSIKESWYPQRTATAWYSHYKLHRQRLTARASALLNRDKSRVENVVKKDYLQSRRQRRSLSPPAAIPSRMASSSSKTLGGKHKDPTPTNAVPRGSQATSSKNDKNDLDLMVDYATKAGAQCDWSRFFKVHPHRTVRQWEMFRATHKKSLQAQLALYIRSPKRASEDEDASDPRMAAGPTNHIDETPKAIAKYLATLPNGFSLEDDPIWQTFISLHMLLKEDDSTRSQVRYKAAQTQINLLAKKYGKRSSAHVEHSSNGSSVAGPSSRGKKREQGDLSIESSSEHPRPTKLPRTSQHASGRANGNGGQKQADNKPGPSSRPTQNAEHGEESTGAWHSVPSESDNDEVAFIKKQVEEPSVSTTQTSLSPHFTPTDRHSLVEFLLSKAGAPGDVADQLMEFAAQNTNHSHTDWMRYYFVNETALKRAVSALEDLPSES